MPFFCVPGVLLQSALWSLERGCYGLWREDVTDTLAVS